MKNIFEILKPPFYYDDYGQKIFDKDNNIALDVKAWGLIQREENAEEIQDNFGKMVAEALNNIAQQRYDKIAAEMEAHVDGSMPISGHILTEKIYD